MDCQSYNPSDPPGIRFVEPEKSRTLKRRRPWDRFKLSLSNALSAVTPGGKSKSLRTASQLRHSFQSTTERTEDASSEFFLTTNEQPIEVALFSPLPEEPEEISSLVTKPAFESETSSEETNEATIEEHRDDTSSESEETNQVTEQETRRPSLKRMNSWPVNTSSKQVSFRFEKDFQSQAILKTRGLKQPFHLSLKQMNTFDDLPTFPQSPEIIDRRKQFAQTKSIGSEKWELSIPTIDEEKSFHFLSSRLERRDALFLKSEGPIEPEPKRVERRNAIVIHTEKPKPPKRKLPKRRKEIITNLEELERFQPISSKMQRRNAIVIHIDSWERSRSYSNKMERRNAIVIHDYDDQPLEEIKFLSEKRKLIQSKLKRTNPKQKRSKSKRIHTRQFSTVRNQGTNGKVLEHRCKFSLRGGLLAVSGIMVAVFLAALPIIIDDFIVMHRETTNISFTTERNENVYNDIVLGKPSERNDSQLLGGEQFLSKTADIETDLSTQKIIMLNMDDAKNFLRDLDFSDLPLF